MGRRAENPYRPTEDREVIARVLTDPMPDLSAAEVARRLRRGEGGEAVRITAEQVRLIRRKRAPQDTRPSRLAERMLTLIARQLTTLEDDPEPDLQRLDALAATLRRVEPLAMGSPPVRAEGEGQASGLGSLLTTDDGDGGGGGEDALAA